MLGLVGVDMDSSLWGSSGALIRERPCRYCRPVAPLSRWPLWTNSGHRFVRLDHRRRRLAALPDWRCEVNVQAAGTGFGHHVSGYVRAFQPMTREGVLPFLAEDDAIPN